MKRYFYLLFFPIALIAQTATAPSSGDGSSGDPYQIATLNNLYWITQNSGEWDAYYIQTANIDASSSSSWDSNAGFTPIGNSGTRFTGSYNGDGHTISNLFINLQIIYYLRALLQHVMQLIRQIFFLLGGISMVFIMPAPVWFIVAALSLAYIQMGWFGWMFSGHKK